MARYVSSLADPSRSAASGGGGKLSPASCLVAETDGGPLSLVVNLVVNSSSSELEVAKCKVSVSLHTFLCPPSRVSLCDKLTIPRCSFSSSCRALLFFSKSESKSLTDRLCSNFL